MPLSNDIVMIHIRNHEEIELIRKGIANHQAKELKKEMAKAAEHPILKNLNGNLLKKFVQLAKLLDEEIDPIRIGKCVSSLQVETKKMANFHTLFEKIKKKLIPNWIAKNGKDKICFKLKTSSEEEV